MRSRIVRASAGIRPIVDRLNPAVRHYDVSDVVQRYFSDKDTSRIFDSWDGLQARLGESYFAYVRAGGSAFDPAYFQPDGTVYTLRLYYLEASGAVQISEIIFKRTAVSVFGDTYSTFVRHLTGAELRVAHALGNTEVMTELKSGTDRRFDDVRNKRLLRQFQSGVDPSRVSLDDGLQFAQLMIRVTHERYSLLFPSKPVLVGSTCDCLVAAPKTGIRRL